MGADEAVDEEFVEEGDDGGGGAITPMAWFQDEDGKPNLPRIGILVALLLAIVLLFWYLNRDDGNGGGDPTPSPTVESVIDDGTETAPSTEPATPGAFPTDESDEPTATSEPRRGGDNQRNRNDTGTPESSSGEDPLAGIELGPVAETCPSRCLVRISGTDDTDSLLNDARTRASFRTEDWIWVVATPEGIAWFEQHTETVLVSTTDETLSLYIARVPDADSEGVRIGDIGTIIDEAGDWRLFQASSVPANVRYLLDMGYQVDKFSPAPPTEYQLTEERTPLANIEIGSLMDDVSSDNIVTTIEDLIAFNTRYYTTESNSQAAEYLFTRLESYGLNVWYEDFLSWEGYLMVNVVGEIPGQDDTSIYGVMAHFDTISDDLGNSPGADDNATGVAASLEIARILNGYELNHPVRVLFVNVEEVGIVGSKELAVRAKEEGTPYAGVFNLDSVGAQRQYAYMVVNGSSETAWMVDLYRRMNEAYGLGQVINAMTNDQIVADDNRFREQGFPSIMVARELYGQSPYHHTTGDTFDTLRIPSVVSCSQLTLLSLAELAKG